jgi:ribosome modulation factor
MRDKVTQSIYNKGAKTFHDGLTIDDCPYLAIDPFSKRHRATWLAGFNNARSECAWANAIVEDTIHGGPKRSFVRIPHDD